MLVKSEKKTKSEPNDLDTIYKVLKKAGEISAAAERSQPTMEIPTVNVPGPDYPDRTPRRLMKSVGPTQQQKQGLTAPNVTDMSSSGPKMQEKFL